jgi:Tfp pilus assembly protein PilP
VFAARPPAAKSTAKALPAPATAKVAGKGSKPAAPIAAKPAIDPNKKSDPRKSADSGKTADATKQSKPEEKKWSMTGKRDPFFSPVVSQTGGSGCSTGKKCLEIGQINLRGVVKSENGFIAVVTNTLNKAYFLREKDPVFNGYVVRITGDSVVFQETVQDKLGKAFTREVVKRIFTPAV